MTTEAKRNRSNWLLLVVSWTSALLCTVTAALWVQSHAAPWTRHSGTLPGTLWDVRSEHGTVRIQHTRWNFPTPPNSVTYVDLHGHRLGYGIPGLEVQRSTAVVRNRLPEETGSFRGPFRTDLPTRPIYSMVVVNTSYLLPFLLFAVTTALFFRKLRRHTRLTRATSGLCPQCAYNLAANTSGVCPECGTPVPPQSEMAT